ncbi:secretory protein [Segetibacter sp. 3557_3]|uniref:basic secretory protein-like protein n=1 Tax=Segetibacter sp. 3557_3 TaxID=2547429 RepID=UPI001058D333|nr:basic secretory protein-like protein [Segetibacter sp. 3557_3]TDH28597.1 secretory protein [Segetibacter sp. 3557_3]
MKKLFSRSLLAFLLFSNGLAAQEVVTRNGYTLTFESNYAELDPGLKQRLIETFFEVYPKLAEEYNPATAREVKFKVDTAYKGVAATSSGRVVFSSGWMQKHPEDIDVVTHEVMHIVQNYGRSTGPGWLTEGIADYARFKFGVDNARAKWALTPWKEGQNYTNSYRVTARFLNWLETNVHAGIVKKLDGIMRAHTYTAQTWETLTGKTLDELWTAYTQAK